MSSGNLLAKSDVYITQNGWYNHLKVGNKQGSIFVRDASDIIQKMALKSYEAPYKVIIIWMAERLNISASNKLLKTFEEPPENTLIILIAERYELTITHGTFTITIIEGSQNCEKGHPGSPDAQRIV